MKFTGMSVLAGLLALLAGVCWAARQADGPAPAAVDGELSGTATPAKPAAGPDAALLDGRDGRPLALERFRPRSMLKVEQHDLRHARFPVVDVHVHPRLRWHDLPRELDEFVPLMDEQNIAVCVSLDGGLGPTFIEHRDMLWRKYRSRWVIFVNVDWRGSGRDNDPASWDCQRPEFCHQMVRRLAEAKDEGASGLKVFKTLGLNYRNPDGSFIRVDDPRWDPIWEACGKLGLPVLIHTADPAAFFLPIDATNERWEELRRHPEWSFYDHDFPSREDLLKQFLTVVGRHPHTVFISPHVANNAEDLAAVASWLDKYSNLNVDIAARVGELGREPFTARKFFLKYADRILFGTDGPRVPERLRLHWRFLETDDEYFPYAETPFPPQGFWNIYGLKLPDDVLRKVYYENASRLIPGVRERVEAYRAAHAGSR